MNEVKLEIDLKALENNFDLFFDNKTYNDLYLEISHWAQHLPTNEDIIVIEDLNPFCYFSQVMACLATGNKPLLLPTKDNSYIKNKIQDITSFTTFTVHETHSKKLLNIKSDQEIYFLSSGTTSNPKMIIHEVKSLLENAKLFSDFFNSHKKESYYLNLPINHIGGFMVIIRAFCNQAYITTTLKEPIDYISLVPTQIQKAIIESSELLNILKNTKALLIGGATLSDQLKKQLNELKIKFYETYGMTETSSFIALNHQLLGDNKVFIDEDNLIYIHSNALFKNILPNPTEPLFIFIDQLKYYRTTDTGQLVNDRIYFKKRIDQIINTGGEKVNLQHLTQKIENLNLAKDFILSSVVDFKWGEKIILFTDDKIDLDTLKKDLIYYEVPKLILSKNLLPSVTKIAKSHFEFAYFNSIFKYEFINNNASETVFVLHGFMENKDDWKGLKEINQNKNWLFLDLPGHGESSLEYFENWQELVFNLCHLLKFFPNVTTLLGYSLGGRVAIEINKLIPINKLILISAGLGANDQQEKDERIKQDKNLLVDVNNNDQYFDFLNQWYKNKIFGNYNQYPEYENNLKFKLKTNKLNEIKKAIIFYSPGNFPLRETQINTLKNATQVFYIYGENDEKYKQQSILLNSLSNIQIFYIEHAFHNLHKTHNSEFKKLIQQIL